MYKLSVLLASSTVFLLTACGGGGGSSPKNPSGGGTIPNNTNNNQSDGITWVADQFPTASTYKDFCAVPRSDSNYADKSGSKMHEKMWLRSFSHETYLWYDEIIDTNPIPFTVLKYFDQLTTPEVTASGKAKDQYHFTYDTEEWLQSSQSGVDQGYGIEWIFGNTTPPRQLHVAFTEQSSPAAINNIERGSKLIEIDGLDFVNTNSNIDQINEGLFPENDNEQHSFTFERVNSEETYTVTLTSQAIETSPVYNSDIIQTDTGDVGYLQFNSFIAPAQSDLVDAFANFSSEQVTDLVLDLRYNGGGLVAMAAQLSYMIGGSQLADNAIFFQSHYNDKLGAEQATPFYQQEIDWNQGLLTNNALPTLNLNRVYILTTDRTCSASEGVINGLRGADIKVIQIGDTTCGKPYGFSPEENCSTTYFTVQFKGENDKGFGDYADGFSPINSLGLVDPDALIEGCAVNDDLSHALGSTDEKLLATALNYRESLTCPTPETSVATASSYKGNLGVEITPPLHMQLLRNNAFITDLRGSIDD
ncbi:MAG: S41 family peptidase [Colwellia sp.]